MDNRLFVHQVESIRMCSVIYCLLVMSTLRFQDAMPQTVSLTASKSRVFENEDFPMACESNGSFSGPFSYWTRNATDNIFGLPLIGYRNNNTDKCEVTYPLNNTDLYIGNCDKNETYFLTLKSVQQSCHGERWQCIRRHGNSLAKSNFVSVYVIVPVAKVTVVTHQNEVITVCEFASVNIVCTTSEARPEPTVTLYLKNNLSTDNSSVSRSNVTSNKNGLFVTTSSLNLSPNRSLSGWEVICSSNNTLWHHVHSSVILNITHPPDNPPAIKDPNLINRETYSIIEKQKGKLTCVVTGGNPPAFLKWKCFNNGNPDVVSSHDVTKDVVWNATRYDVNQCECIAQHSCNNWTRSVIVKIRVLYPPSIEKIADVSVIEGSMLNISSDAKRGVPESIIVKWTREKDKFKNISQNLFMPNVSRDDISKYQCEVSNVMIPTVGQQETGMDSTVFNIDVLYPALVSKHSNKTIIEGDVLIFTCPVLLGNPTKMTVKWTPDGHSNNWTLHIPSVSRHDIGTYNCSVNSTMKPTHGTSKYVVKNGQFQLNVVYHATLMDFYIGNQTNNGTVIVNEKEHITFRCVFESNPPPKAFVSYDKQEVFTSNKNVIEYRKSNIQCIDFGEYICSGMNDYNYGTPSTKSLTLFVNCSPRPYPNVLLKTRVASSRNTSATLSFAALAYPKPGPKGFTWYFVNGSDNFTLNNNSNFLIKRSNMQSNLTIRNVSEVNYGQYRLHIMNDIDVYEETFFLTPYEEPDPPVVLNWTAGETYVTIFIKPGFNGGYTQWFNLRYAEASTDNWSNILTITDNILDVFSYNISNLSPGKTYKVLIFAENDIGNSSDVRESVTTKATFTASKPTVSSSSKTSGVIAGTVVGGIVLICIVIAGLFYLRNRMTQKMEQGIYQNVPFSGQKLKTKQKTNPCHVDETSFSDLQEVDDIPNVTSEPTEYYNSPEIIENIERINVSELYSYVTGKSDDSFEANFKKLPTGLQKPCTFARKPENLAMNRYNGIYPYDHSRVKLHGLPDFFINACYIDGYKRSKAYIASLGPTSNTTDGFATFWQMIWHEKSDIIVMLTNLREPSGMKCEQYWPAVGTSKTYGDVCVGGQKEVVFAEYTVRHLSISKEDELRSVVHLHYTAWPDKKVPEDATSLLEFRLIIKDIPRSSNGPIIIHCSAGIGRTGTLIALDRLIEEGQCEGSVNVFDCVNSIREQRVKMVQTAEQYIYIYKALVNALSFECETIPVQSFQEYVDSTNDNIYSKQFQQLTLSVQTDSKEELEALAINEKERDKNRTGADIPGNRSRVFLYQDRVDEQSDYVNAVYVNSLRKKDFFIAAQSPLPKTVSDFVCMVYQEDCTCIVTMDDLNEPDMKTVGQYLPADKRTLTVGNYIVSCTKLETKQHYVVRKMKIKFKGKFESGEKVIYHFQYTKWMKGNVIPSSANDFVQFVNDMEEYASELGEDSSHVIVHCLKANERCGLFCAVAVLMQKMKFERHANVLYTLRHLRNRRRSAITDMEQLKFCYLAVSAYIKMYNL